MVHKKVSVVLDGEILALLSAMEAHPKDAGVQNQACFALKNITLRSENVEALVAEKTSEGATAKELLEKSMDILPENVRKHAEMSLQRISKYYEKRKTARSAPKTKDKRHKEVKGRGKFAKGGDESKQLAGQQQQEEDEQQQQSFSGFPPTLPIQHNPSFSIPHSPQSLFDHKVAPNRPSSVPSEPTTGFHHLGHKMHRPSSASSDPGPTGNGLPSAIPQPHELGKEFLRASNPGYPNWSGGKQPPQVSSLPPLQENCMFPPNSPLPRPAVPLAIISSGLVDSGTSARKFQNVAEDLFRSAMAAGQQGDFSSARVQFDMTFKIKKAHYGPEAANEALVNCLNCLGYAAACCGDGKAALGAYQESLQMQCRLGGGKLLIANTLATIGTLHLKTGNYTLAEECLTRAVKEKGALYGTDNLHIDMARDLESLGDIKELCKDYEEADKMYKYSAACYRNAAEHAMELSSIIVKLGLLADRRGDHFAGQCLLEKALELKRTAYGTDARNNDIVNVLKKLACVCAINEDVFEAIANYEESIDMQRDLAESDETKQNLANTLMSVGVLYMNEGNHDIAKDNLAEALDLKRAIVRDENDDIPEDLVDILQHLGEISIYEEDFCDAEAYYEEALEHAKLLVYYEEALHHASLSSNAKSGIIGVYMMLSNILYKLGHLRTMNEDFETAHMFYSNSLLIKERLYRNNKLQLDLVLVLEGLGYVHAVRCEYSVSIDKYEAAFKIRQQMLGVDVVNVDLAKILNTLGVLYLKQGGLSAAYKNLQEALIMLRVLDENSTSSSIPDTLKSLGDVHFARKQYEDAEAAYEEAYSILEEVEEGAPQTSSSLKQLAIIRSKIGELAGMRGDATSAQEHLKAVVQNQRALDEQDVSKLDLAEAYSKLGYAYALGGKTDEAIKSYEESVSLQQSAHGSDTECGDIAKTLNSLNVLHSWQNGFTGICYNEEVLDSERCAEEEEEVTDRCYVEEVLDSERIIEEDEEALESKSCDEEDILDKERYNYEMMNR